jgi:hypothetical protein
MYLLIIKAAQPGMQATRFAFPIRVRGLNNYRSPSVSGVPIARA